MRQHSQKPPAVLSLQPAYYILSDLAMSIHPQVSGLHQPTYPSQMSQHGGTLHQEGGPASGLLSDSSAVSRRE